MSKSLQNELPQVVAGVMRWGAWGAHLNTKQLQTLIEGCLEAEVSAFDHADIYGDYTEEAAFGAVLKENPGLRSSMQLVTKCGIKMLGPGRPQHKLKSYDSSAAHIRASVDNSLRELHTDYLDIVLLHRPDFLLRADEVAEVFEELTAAGKVRHFGVSNFTPSQFQLLHSRWPNLLTNQVEFSLQHLAPLTDGTFDQAQELSRAPMIWSPLAGGKLFDESLNSTLSAKLQAVAERHGTSPGVIAMAWIFAHPSRPCVVTGSSKLSRILEAKEALTVKLSREEWYELLEARRGYEVA